MLFGRIEIMVVDYEVMCG